MKYLIAFNNEQTVFDGQKLHKQISGKLEITDWWHYLPAVYIIDTQMNSSQISSFITSSLPGQLFFVAKVDLNDSNGLLPKNAWEWISKKNRVVFKLKTVNQPKSLFKLPLSTNPPKSKPDINDILRRLSKRAKDGK